MAKKAKKKAKKKAAKKAGKKKAKKSTKKAGKKTAKKGAKKAAKKTAKKGKKKARRTVMYSTGGKKLYAVRNSDGQFKDIQTYERAHAADMRQSSNEEQAAAPNPAPGTMN